MVPCLPRAPARRGDSVPLIETIRLQRELRRVFAEVDASRARMLRAAYEERRCLERDLHDGAQQRLVSLGMSLRVLQRTHPYAVGLFAPLDQAVAELRQIAHGMRPSDLDDGPGPALANLIRRWASPVDLSLAAGDLPDEVSTTVY